MKDFAIALGLLVASMAGGVALMQADTGQAPWFVSRASGLMSFVLLTGSVVLGLVMSGRMGVRTIPRPLAFSLHQFLSVLTLAFIGVHAGALLFDGFLRFSPIEILVPFAAGYERLWTGLGVLSGWSAAAVTASFWAKRRLGHARWRKLHYLSFAAWGASLVHGMFAGTDAALAPVHWLYFGSAALVAGLLVYRIGGQGTAKPATARTRKPPGIAGSAAAD